MRRTSLFCAIGISVGMALGWFLAGGQSMKSEAAATAPVNGPPRVHHILLEVTNIDVTVPFYRDMFGMTPHAVNATFTTLQGANVDIYLSSSPWDWKAPKGKDERLGLGMYPHFEVADVKETVSRIMKAGYRVVQEPKSYDWGTEAFVTDPDGYTWALITRSKIEKR